MSESLAATDARATNADWFGAASEAPSVTSAQAGIWNGTAAASESMAATSAQSALADLLAAASESAALTSAEAGTAVYPVAVSETLAVTTIQTESTTSGFALASVDLDNDIYHGQTGVVILPSGTFAASGNLVEIEQSGTTVQQTVTAESTSSITITVNLTGLTVPGSATLRVFKPM